MKNKISYNIIKLFWNILSVIPMWFLYIISDFCFLIVYYCIGYRKNIVRKNLMFAYPVLTEKELVNIEKRFYRFLCDMFFETSKLVFWDEAKIREHIRFTHMEEANESLRQGRSISLFLGHYGNWEWVSSLGIWLEKNAVKAQIYKRLSSEISDKLMQETRSKFGVKCIEMRQTLRHIVEQKFAGKTTITGYISDQSPSREESKVFVDFMNKRVPVLTGAERITKKFSFEAYFLDIRRVRRGYWEAKFVKMHDNPASLDDFKLTEIFYDLLRKMIDRQPEFYLWSHNRFKNAI